MAEIEQQREAAREELHDLREQQRTLVPSETEVTEPTSQVGDTDMAAFTKVASALATALPDCQQVFAEVLHVAHETYAASKQAEAEALHLRERTQTPAEAEALHLRERTQTPAQAPPALRGDKSQGKALFQAEEARQAKRRQTGAGVWSTPRSPTNIPVDPDNEYELPGPGVSEVLPTTQPEDEDMEETPVLEETPQGPAAGQRL
eukprot:551556-Amphidinium_carterae.1